MKNILMQVYFALFAVYGEKKANFLLNELFKLIFE